MNRPNGRQQEPGNASQAVVLLAWLLVAVPLIWGIWQTIKKASALFR
jgi:hypothetical protein